MGFNKLIEAALIVVMMDAAIGEIPRLIQTVREAQLRLLRESRTSDWGRALLHSPEKH
jgi:hypothetical protein